MVRRTVPSLVGRGWVSFWERYAAGNDIGSTILFSCPYLADQMASRSPGRTRYRLGPAVPAWREMVTSLRAVAANTTPSKAQGARQDQDRRAPRSRHLGRLSQGIYRAAH